MKISVIIPVYNVEDFIERCLKSLEEQTLKDFEAIIVDDGSPDNSYQIIDKYVARNDNFFCFKIENSGQGGARNFGLTKATGEYIVFLDSDDYIAPDCLEKLLAAAEKNESDIVLCANYDVAEDGTILSLQEHNVKSGTTTLEETPAALLNRPCPWGKIFRKSLFGDLEFISRVWYEDFRLIPKLLLKATKISFIPDPLFFYVQRAGSTMNNANAKRNLEIIPAFEDLISYMKEKGLYETYKAEVDYMIVEHILIAAVTRVVLSRAAERKDVLRTMRAFISQFDGLHENKYLSTLTFNKKLILFFNKHRFYPLTYLCMKAKQILSK